MSNALVHFSFWRRAVVWLAVIGLLNNVMLPAAVSMAAGSVGFSICSAASAGNSHDKAKPALLVHHCALCAAPAAPLPRPQFEHPLPIELAVVAPAWLRTTPLAAFPWHSWVQARAPPSSA
jgi:hypothetical protein